MIGALHGGTGLWDVVYDLQEERFFHRTSETPSATHIVLMQAASSANSLFEQVPQISA